MRRRHNNSCYLFALRFILSSITLFHFVTVGTSAVAQTRRLCFSGYVSRIDPDVEKYPEYEGLDFIQGVSLGQSVSGYFSFASANSVLYSDEVHSWYGVDLLADYDPIYAVIGSKQVVLDRAEIAKAEGTGIPFWSSVLDTQMGGSIKEMVRMEVSPQGVARFNGVDVDAGVQFSNREKNVLTAPLLPLDAEMLKQFERGIFSLSRLGRACPNCGLFLQRIFADITNVTDCDPILVDPVFGSASLLQNGAVTDDPDVLISGGRPITGVAADGIAQAVIRLGMGNPNELVQFTVRDESKHGVSSTSEFGALAPPGVVSPSNGSLTITTVSVPTSAGPKAFAVYRAPSDFAAGGRYYNFLSRTVNIEVKTFQSDGTPVISYIELDIIRPPVILIHGLHSYPKYWKAFTPIVRNPRYYSRTLDYSYPVSVSESDLELPETWTSTVRAHSLSLDYNAPLRLQEVRQHIEQFKSGTEIDQPLRVASVRADVVGHSYGGLIARRMSYLPDYVREDNYNKGVINRLITLGTPHLGSHIATRLFDGQNNCMARSQHLNGSHIFRSATVDGMQSSGAAFDLQGGEGFGYESKSPAIRRLSEPLPNGLRGVRAAMIAGALGPENFAPLDSPLNVARDTALTLCGTKKLAVFNNLPVITFGLDGPGDVIIDGDPLADWYSSSRWNLLFNGSANDALVSNESAFNGRTQRPTNLFTAAHGPGSVGSISKLLDGGALGFGGYYLQEEASGAPSRVEQLLNLPPEGEDYEWIP